MEINKFNQTMKYLTRPAERPGQSLEDLTVTTDLPEEGMEFQSVIEGFGEGLDRNESQDFDKGGVVEREELFQGGPLDPEVKKKIRAFLKENNVKPDFKSYKFGVPKGHPLHGRARYFQSYVKVADRPGNEKNLTKEKLVEYIKNNHNPKILFYK